MPFSVHSHSWYSLLEGASSLEALLERAAAGGYSSLALTDSNNLYGAVRFTELARRYGIRPILGACLRQGREHCVALIADREGYRNLCRIISRLWLTDACASRPENTTRTLNASSRLVELLAENAAGLHVLVDDIGLAGQLRAAFGQRLWLEIVRPGRTPAREQELLAAGRRLGLAPVASMAVHFASAGEYPIFRLATCIRQGGLLEQMPGRLRITPEHHLLSPEKLRQRFHDLPEAVRNTDRLAEQLDSDVLPRDTILPPPRVPRSLDSVAFLRLLCARGLRRRGLGEDLGARQRLREELAVIEAGGLPDYFLVVRDIARYARRHQYSMALRGSAGNSLVCFLLEITDVNPLRFDLPHERFLYPGRPDLPDIDLDFDWKVRDAVIAQVFRRYGQQHTAMISSHLFLQPRSAFREAAKVHGLSNEQISRLLETAGARVETLLTPGKALTSAKVPPGFPLEPERWPRIVRDARLILGLPHHLNIHPGGIVITPRPIEEYVPLQMAPKGIVITQFEKDAIEHIGLVKIDLLGNRALATVDEARARAQAPAGEWERGGPDQATLDLVRRGDTLGVNQVESPAMRHLLVQLQVRGVEDVILALALVRPGAASGGVKERFLQRRHGLEKFAIHPRLEKLLRPTAGFMIFEDDAARVVQALTGLSAPESQRFYKRVIKHENVVELQALAEEFIRACARQGIGQELAGEQFLQLTKFHHYAFCKSHSVSYGLIAWKSCYLKAHQPLAFWTAVLNNNQGMYPRRVYAEAIKRAGIELRLPCINRSLGPCIPEDGGIRVGLDCIATLPEEFRERLLQERERHGPFRDLADFCRRLAPGPETLAVLIRSGALDFTGLSRPALFLKAEISGQVERGSAGAQERRSAERTLRSCAPALHTDLFPEAPESSWLSEWSPVDYDTGRRWRDEWALLGFLVGPPLLSLFRKQLPEGLVRSCDLAQNLGQQVRVAGVVATYRNTTTSSGRDMQFITLEDEWGLTELTLFPGRCPPLPYLQMGPYVATGMVEDSLGVVTVNVTDLAMISGE